MADLFDDRPIEVKRARLKEIRRMLGSLLEAEAKARQKAQGYHGAEGGRGHEKPLVKTLTKGLDPNAGRATTQAAKITGTRIVFHWTRLAAPEPADQDAESLYPDY